MKNANYNLVKMLLQKLDDTWRIEKHYCEDAREMDCPDCAALFERILAEDQKQSELLRAELAKHIQKKRFD